MHTGLLHNIYFNWSQEQPALIIGIATSFLLAIIIYLSMWNILENSLYNPPYGLLLAQPASVLPSLCTCHILVHWSMTFYAQTYLGPTHKLQQFHYLMAGTNLFFVVLFLAQTHLNGDLITSQYLELQIGIHAYAFGFNVYTAWKKHPTVVHVFDYPIDTNVAAEVAEKLEPYYFTLIVLLNFWHKPFVDNFFVVRLFFELTFITHTCLVKTYIHTNEKWAQLIGCLMYTYFVTTLGTGAPSKKLTIFGWNSLLFAVKDVIQTVTQTKLEFEKVIAALIVLSCFLNYILGEWTSFVTCILPYIFLIITLVIQHTFNAKRIPKT